MANKKRIKGKKKAVNCESSGTGAVVGPLTSTMKKYLEDMKMGKKKKPWYLAEAAGDDKKRLKIGDKVAPFDPSQNQPQQGTVPSREAGRPPVFARGGITMPQIVGDLARRGIDFKSLPAQRQKLLSQIVGMNPMDAADFLDKAEERWKEELSTEKVRSRSGTGQGSEKFVRNKLNPKIEDSIKHNMPRLKAMADNIVHERRLLSQKGPIKIESPEYYIKQYLLSFLTSFPLHGTNIEEKINAALKRSGKRDLKLTGGIQERDRVWRLYSQFEDVPEDVLQKLEQYFADPKHTDDVIRANRTEMSPRVSASAGGERGDVMGSSGKQWQGDKSERIAVTGPQDYFGGDTEESEGLGKMFQSIEDFGLEPEDLENMEPGERENKQTMDYLLNKLGHTSKQNLSDFEKFDLSNKSDEDKIRIGRNEKERKLDEKVQFLKTVQGTLEKKIRDLATRMKGSRRAKLELSGKHKKLHDELKQVSKELEGLDRARGGEEKMRQILTKAQQPERKEGTFNVEDLGEDFNSDEVRKVVSEMIFSRKGINKIARYAGANLVKSWSDPSSPINDGLKQDYIELRQERLRLNKLRSMKPTTFEEKVLKYEARHKLEDLKDEIHKLKQFAINVYGKRAVELISAHMEYKNGFKGLMNPEQVKQDMTPEEAFIYDSVFDKLNIDRIIKNNPEKIVELMRGEVGRRETEKGRGVESLERSHYYEKMKPQEREEQRNFGKNLSPEKIKDIETSEKSARENPEGGVALYPGLKRGEGKRPEREEWQRQDQYFSNRIKDIDQQIGRLKSKEKEEGLSSKGKFVIRKLENQKAKLLAKLEREKSLAKKIPEDKPLPSSKKKDGSKTAGKNREKEIKLMQFRKARMEPLKAMLNNPNLSPEKRELIKKKIGDISRGLLDPKPSSKKKKLAKLGKKLKESGMTINLKNLKSLIEEEISSGRIDLREMLIGADNGKKIEHAEKKEKSWEKAKPQKKKDFYPKLESLFIEGE